MGTIVRIGPGFFPVAIGCVIALIGALIIVPELLTGNKTEPVELVHLRPLVVITLAVMAFGLLIRPMGLVIRVATLVLVGAFGRREIRPLETLGLIAVLFVFFVVLFVYGLNLPLSMWPDPWSFSPKI